MSPIIILGICMPSLPCACIICECRWDARGMCYVCYKRSCLVCEKSCLVREMICLLWDTRVAGHRLHSVVNSSTSGTPKYPNHNGRATPLFLPSISIAKERHRPQSTNLSWAYPDCVTHIWPIPMALGRVHVHSSIQSLVLMRSATSTAFFGLAWEG